MNTRRWQTTRSLLALIVLTFNLGAYAQAQTSEPGGKHAAKPHTMKKMHGGMHHRMKSYAGRVVKNADVLGLSDEQLGKIVRIKMTEKKAAKAIKEKLHKSMRDVLKGLRNPNMDEAAIRKAGADHAADFNALIDNGLKARKATDAVLTAEQQAKMKTIKPTMDSKQSGRAMNH